MSVGLAVTKSELDARAGDIARAFQRSFDDVAVMKGFLDATVDQDLIDLGYTATEVADLKTAWADLADLAMIWSGSATLPAAKDFRVFVRRLWGVGAF